MVAWTCDPELPGKAWRFLSGTLGKSSTWIVYLSETALEL
jgi:hypothetical protein